MNPDKIIIHKHKVGAMVEVLFADKSSTTFSVSPYDLDEVVHGIQHEIKKHEGGK